MLRRFAVLVFLASLGGCATPRFVEKSIDQKVADQWHRQVIRADIFQGGVIGVRSVSLPVPVPPVWVDELADFSRAYTGTGKKQDMEPLVTEVERAIFYQGEQSVGFFDAVFDWEGALFDILVPPVRIPELVGSSVLIVSGRGTFGLTTLGETVDLRKVEDLRKLPPGFFRDHPSPTETIVPMEIGNPFGRRYIIELANRYRFNATTPNLQTKYLAASPHVAMVAKTFTPADTVLDRLGSCTNLRLSIGSVSSIEGAALTGLFYADEAVAALAAEDCMKAESIAKKIRRMLAEAWQQVTQPKE